jgi:hypothetical protein
VASNYKKLTGHVRPDVHVDEIVLAKDGDGNVTRSVKLGVPVSLDAEDRNKLEAQGYTFEDSSAEEHKKYEEGLAANPQAVGDDIVGAAPVFGEVAPNQNVGKADVDQS